MNKKTETTVPPMYMNEALDVFEEWSSLRGMSHETMRGYYVDSQQFARWIGEKSNAPVLIPAITVQHIEEFMRYLVKERKCMPRSVNRKLNTLAMFFQCMKKKNIIAENPLDEIERMKVPDTERTYLNRDEVEAIIDAINHPVLHYFALTMAYSGIRVNECIHLKLIDVNLDESYIQVINGKGGKNRRVPLSSHLAEQLTIYLQKHRPETNSLYFFATKRSGTVSTQYVNRILLEAYQKANIDKHVTSHILRHSFASYLVSKDTHVAVIQKLLGHASLKTTSIYLHVHQDDMKEAIERIDF
ncbi:tyrosine-type recombinase/integrase [Sporosarcina sp. JAI121]|uniref:tyrosine-type recombinase/integrase n=1 Tax=Sporosarcina sp. JAI121 TaxID=2723064 RepID=UPI0015CD558E|nr:tyrosine-type recombinase/integrase [Sporosarcina sp. JAI121]NYF23570.1 integrase/recombinase XerD [Sporosarcina sp. JAI121]